VHTPFRDHRQRHTQNSVGSAFFFDAFETIALFTPVFPPPAQIAQQHSDRLKNCANHRTHEPIVHVYDGKPKGRPRDRGEPRMRRIRPAFEGVIK